MHRKSFYKSRNQQKAANNQTDSTTVTIKTSVIDSAGTNIREVYSMTSLDMINNHIRRNMPEERIFDLGVLPINVFDVLLNSEYFNTFASMYDQCKIDSVKVVMNTIQWLNGTENGVTYTSNKDATVTTAWDRTGLDKSQFKRFNEVVDYRPVRDPVDGINYQYPVFNESDAYFCHIGNKRLRSYSSAQSKYLGNTSTFECTRYLYPQTFQEKTQYISTSLLRPGFYKKYGVDSNRFNEYYVYDGNGENGISTDPNYYSDSKNPCSFYSDSTIGFKPTLLVGVNDGYENEVNEKTFYSNTPYQKVVGTVNKTSHYAKFEFDFEIVVTFRGLRYNKIKN